MESMKNNSLWMRICARFFDYSLLFGIGHLISLVIPYDITALFYWILALSVPLLFIPIEALLLTLKGTTPGKDLFVMSVKGEGKNSLTFKEAFKRAFFIGKRPGEVVQREPTLFRLVSAYAATAALLSFSILSQNITNYTIGCERQQKVSGWLHFVSEEAGFHVSFPTK